MKTKPHETTAEVVGLSRWKHQDRLDEADTEIQEPFEKKCSCHNHLLERSDDQAAKAAYKTACSTLQAKLKSMKNDWWTAAFSLCLCFLFFFLFFKVEISSHTQIQLFRPGSVHNGSVN